MHVNADRAALGRIQKSHAPSRIPVRKKTQIGTTPKRRPKSRDFENRHGELHDRPAGRLHPLGISSKVGYAIIRMRDGKDAGIESKTEFSQYLKRPQRFISYGKTGSAIAGNTTATAILQQGLRSQRVLAKFLARHFIHGAVTQAMAGDFVAAIGHFSHNFGMLLRHPAKGEERRLASRRVEQIEQSFGVLLNSTCRRTPPVHRHLLAERADVVVVFEIDCKGISDGLICADPLRKTLSHDGLDPLVHPEPSQSGDPVTYRRKTRLTVSPFRRLRGRSE